MAVIRIVDDSGRRIDYERRRPERSVLYRVVADNMQTLFAQAEANSEHGFGYPQHVKRELQRFLTCGQLAAGFARIQCGREGCTFERLVAYSCKGRSICPSCISRRMADAAAHLADHVLPRAPYRQWTLSLPYKIRFRVGYDRALMTKVVSAFLRTIFTWQRRRARREGVCKPLTGAVTLCQRFGSFLQFTPHFHSWIPDGVFSEDESGVLSFHRLEPPDDADVEQLLARIARRIDTLLDICEPTDLDDEHAAVAAHALIPPLSPLAGGFALPQRPRCAFLDGYSLHADLDVHQNDRKTLERLLRYGLRPPFSQRRLSLTGDGKLMLKLRKPSASGQTQIVLEPIDFLRRLVATIPPQRMNLVRFHGVFAPNAKVRGALRTLVPTPRADPAAAKGTTGHECRAPNPPTAPDADRAVPVRYRRAWHELLKRVFGIDLVCAVCGHRMHRIAHIDDSETITRILDHLGLPTTLPPVAPARAPPQLDLDFDFDHSSLHGDELAFDDVS